MSHLHKRCSLYLSGWPFRRGFTSLIIGKGN